MRSKLNFEIADAQEVAHPGFGPLQKASRGLHTCNQSRNILPLLTDVSLALNPNSETHQEDHQEGSYLRRIDLCITHL